MNLANSYFYKYKASPRIRPQHRVLPNLRKNEFIVITKPDKGNGVVILDWKLYDNAFQEIISDTFKFKKFNEDPNLKREASIQHFLRKLKQNNFFIDNMYANIIFLVFLTLLKYTTFLLVTHFLNFVQLFHL